MKLKSFAYLKKTDTCIITDGAQDEKKKAGKTLKKEKKTTQDEKTKFVKNQKEIPTKKNPVHSSFLMESGYCYGCYNFTVDAPGTDLEVGFCKRVNKDDGLISFKVIQKTTLIKQCPGKVDNKFNNP